MTFIRSPMKPEVYMIAIIVVIVFCIYTSLLFLFCSNKYTLNDNTILFNRILAILILFVVTYLAVHRDTFLPFLGETVFPFTLVKAGNHFSHGNVSKTIHVDAPNGTKVVYWAAKPDNKVDANPKIAYDDYSNSGVTLVQNGEAKLTINCPAQYKVPPFNETLEKHVHYRIIYTNGMISEVHTVRVKC
jgi:hypothetical protein